jgi:pyruvate kinase
MAVFVGPDGADFGWVGDQVRELEAAMQRLEVERGEAIRRVHPEHRADATNLVDYVALRRADFRQLQRALASLGLSSLGRCEPHVRATVAAVRQAFEDGVARAAEPIDPTAFSAGRQMLDRNTDALLGARPEGRVTRIMVTLPSEAAHDPALARTLVVKGMDVARVNGAHDDPSLWRRMVEHVRSAASEVGRPCRVSMDMAGPKLRTGPLQRGPEVVRVKPGRDLRGVAVTAARLVFVAAGADSPEGSGTPCVPVDGAWVARRRPADLLELTDTRGSRRRLTVVDASPGWLVTEVWNTTYVERGTEVRCGDDRTTIGPLAPVRQFHRVRAGDAIVVRRSLDPAVPWWSGQDGVAVIGCTLPAVFGAVRPGERAVFDDGGIEGLVESVDHDEFTVRVVAAGPNGAKLRAEKGINLPDTELPVAVVSDTDIELIAVAAHHADMLALSFVRHEDDVDDVRHHLARAGGDDLGLVVKVETSSAFSRLPEILLRAMQTRLVGVMIARGDLAIEAGYGRLAEVQEEILWLSEAAHLPVIWATEVLDQLARRGQPSRAEITDAAMAQRAECVMLNKGPHIETAIEILDDILRRMSGHQRKKAALLRPLRSWTDCTP